MSCAAGRWGDIAIDASTQHVDGAYTGGSSDGSAARPWTTINAAVEAAAPGAVVAIARGTYVEAVRVAYEPVRLHGVCPAEVAIVSTSLPALECPPASICILYGAHGTEVHGVSLRGDGIGIGVSGVEQVLIDQVHVHDTLEDGINAQVDLGPTSLRVTRSLIERGGGTGIHASGVGAAIEASTVRDTLPDAAQSNEFGHGIVLQAQCLNGACVRGEGSVIGSLVERNRAAAIMVQGADVRIEASVVRDTQPQASDQTFGRGLIVTVDDSARDHRDNARSQLSHTSHTSSRCEYRSMRPRRQTRVVAIATNSNHLRARPRVRCHAGRLLHRALRR